MWRTFGASVRGSSHTASGSECQDAFAFWNLTDEVVVLAVADGAGSASHAGIAAKAAVAEAVGFCRGAFESPTRPDQWEDVLSGALNAAKELIAALAAEQACAPRDLATTLQVVLATPSGFGYARVGDGCCVVSAEGRLAAIGPRPDNEYVNETEFLTTVSPRRTIVIEHGPCQGIALFTDGLQNVALRLAEWQPHEPFFRPLFTFAAKGPSEASAVEALAQLLSGAGVESRTDDDRTLLLSAWGHVGE